LELNILYIPQECRTGAFLDSGWLASMRRKVAYVIESILDARGKDEYFVHSDCDIVFFNNFMDNLLDQIQDFEIACINDVQMLCAGFFIARADNTILKLFENILQHMDKFGKGGGGADQLAMNFFIREMGIRAKALDFRYHNIFHSIGREWTSETDFQIPGEIILHHANFTRGVATKIKLMDLMLSKAKYEDIEAHARA
jgi:Nucleotide-diphospho-sugar transferase